MTAPLRACYLQAPNQLDLLLLRRRSGAHHPTGMVPTTAEAAAGPRRVMLTQWVVFVCSGVRYGIPLDSVAEILAPVPCTRVPGAAAGVVGLAGIRGSVVPVFDLGLLLGHGSSAALDDHRLLLLEAGGRNAAAAVDQVKAVAPARLEGTGIVRADGALRRCVSGIARDDEGTFEVLTPALLLQAMLDG